MDECALWTFAGDGGSTRDCTTRRETTLNRCGAGRAVGAGQSVRRIPSSPTCRHRSAIRALTELPVGRRRHPLVRLPLPPSNDRSVTDAAHGAARLLPTDATAPVHGYLTSRLLAITAVVAFCLIAIQTADTPPPHNCGQKKRTTVVDTPLALARALGHSKTNPATDSSSARPLSHASRLVRYLLIPYARALARPSEWSTEGVVFGVDASHSAPRRWHSFDDEGVSSSDTIARPIHAHSSHSAIETAANCRHCSLNAACRDQSARVSPRPPRSAVSSCGGRNAIAGAEILLSARQMTNGYIRRRTRQRH
uniref:Uncharacterized protein n=1 Tax=Plectus sambesii TaxID=2011161 RepID=A0A914UY50_9BILA